MVGDEANGSVFGLIEPVGRATVDASPLRDRLILLSGSPLAIRAAATALAARRTVRIAPVATGIFDHGITQMAGSWVTGHYPGPSQGNGLCALFDSRSIMHELRALSDALLERVRGDADVLVDRAPLDEKALQFAHALYPDATFVHTTFGRDPQRREAAAARSTVAASGVPHIELSVDAILVDPTAALDATLARTGARGPLSPRLPLRLDQVLRDGAQGFRWRARTRA